MAALFNGMSTFLGSPSPPPSPEPDPELLRLADNHDIVDSASTLGFVESVDDTNSACSSLINTVPAQK